MPQSLDRVIVHVVFGTKGRWRFIDDNVRPRLHAYLATVVRSIGNDCIRVGGVADHVHIALALGRTVTVAETVERAKTSATQWIRRQGPEFRKFAWQRGYAVFSVSPRDLNTLVAYIDGQAEHHARRSFEDEYVGFLRQYGIEFDEQHIWS